MRGALGDLHAMRHKTVLTVSTVDGLVAPGNVLHVPHASVVIPPKTRADFILPDDELSAELLRMTGAYTDELFALDPGIASTVSFPISRLVVDPERFEDDTVEPMAARGMGVLYTHSSQRRAMRRIIEPHKRVRLLNQWYRPHHMTLTNAVDRALEATGACFVVDCHSFASSPLPYELDQSADRPQVCLGTDPFHTDARLAHDAQQIFLRAGFTVALNRPFAGALVPMKHFRRDRRVRALMVEINRGLYMDETSGQRLQEFEELRSRLRDAFTSLIAATSGVR